MKEPSEKDIKKEQQSELDKIAEMNAKCVAGYQIIRNTVFNGIETDDLDKMNKYITSEYGKVYTGLKGMIIDALNDSKDQNVKLVEKLLDRPLPPPKHYEVLPKTAPFKYTNRVFTQKSVSIRSQKAADAITKIIADGRNEGLAIKDIQKKIDTVMGFRDAQGRLTDKSKKLIESGMFAHKNGSIYETYRIARTETMRMNAFAKYDEFLEIRKTYPNARLKLKATIDGREREQSKEMNEQVSSAMGLFLYPDRKYYRLGTAPARWCINDREVQYIVFLKDKEVKENQEELIKENKNFKEFRNIEKEYTEEISSVQNIKEIEQQIKDIGQFKNVDLKELPLDVIQDVYVTNKKVMNLYPQLKGGSSLKTANLANDVYANNIDLITAINLNRNFYKNHKALSSSYSIQVQTGYHPFNTSANAILIHEYGHSLQKYIELKKGIQARDIKKEVLKRAGQKAKDVSKNLSDYAKKDVYEFFAEAFAEYLDSPKPRKLARIFGEYLNEILN